MKKRTLFIGFVIAATAFLLSCSDKQKVSAYNRQIFDTNYSFDKAVIDLHNEIIEVDVETWKDYDDGEQLQIIAKDGTVYLTSSYNCTLIKTR